MNVVSKLALAMLLNLLVIGCTPVNVSLNSEFGLSVSKTPSEEQTTKIPKITVDTLPSFINQANATSFNFAGTCENLTKIVVRINASNNTSTATCTSGLWSINLDSTTYPDGTLAVEFLESTKLEVIKSMSLQKDTQAPTAILGSTLSSITNNNNVLISVAQGIGVSQYSFKVGLVASTDCAVATGYSGYIIASADTLASTFAGDGNYKLCLIGKDAFGNEQAYASATTVSWQLDTVAPSISFVSSTSLTYINTANRGSFSITANCSEAIRSITFKSEDKNLFSLTNVETCSSGGGSTSTFNFGSLAEGSVKISATQRDAAGNTTTLLLLTVLKDTQGPVFSSTTVSDGNYYASLTQTPIISWPTATDLSGSGFSEFQFGIGSSTIAPDKLSFLPIGSVTSNQHTFVSPLSQNTSYYAFVKAIDLAGNSTVLVSDGWKTDTLAPTVGTVDDGVSSVPGTTPTVSWGAGGDGTGSGIDHYELAIGTSSGGTQVLTWTSVGDSTSVSQSNSALNFGGGTYYVSIRSVDKAGNISSPSLGDGFIVVPTISEMTSNTGAHAAITTNGKVIAWGDSSFGGTYADVPSVLRTGSLTATAIRSASNAFAVITNDGAVYAWGNSANGGSTATVASEVNGTIDVEELASTNLAFAARRSNGSVVAWGGNTYGGEMDSTAKLALNGTIPAVALKSTNSAFAALRSNGSVVAWGLTSGGGDASAVASQIDGTIPVVELYSTSTAFIARRNDGSLVTWGYYSGGVNFSSIASDVNGTIPVISVYTNQYAVAAVRNDGSVITWGVSASGGDSGTVAGSINGTIDVSRIYSNPSSFAALRIDGSVITWGSTANGGNSIGVSAELTGSPYQTTVIAHCNTAFAAIRNNGSVIPWGLSGGGGTLGPLPATAVDGSVSKVTYITGSYSAFAALRENGSVVTWGSSAFGGDSSAVATKISGGKAVVALFANQYSFVAVYADGQFVTWGDSTYGGDSSSINPN